MLFLSVGFYLNIFLYIGCHQRLKAKMTLPSSQHVSVKKWSRKCQSDRLNLGLKLNLLILNFSRYRNKTHGT